jgi:hypothetical protein
LNFFKGFFYILFVVGRKGGFLTATVSDLPVQPKRSFTSAKKIFLALSAAGFWLYLFGIFGFFYIQILAWS